MSKAHEPLSVFLDGDYQHGFVTEVESETFPPGLDESVIRRISAMKNEPEFLLDFRLKAFAHWQTMETPEWSSVHYPAIDFQEISYYSAPKSMEDMPKSLDEVDPELLKTYEKLGIPLREQEMLAGVAVEIGIQESAMQVCTWNQWVTTKAAAAAAATAAAAAEAATEAEALTTVKAGEAAGAVSAKDGGGSTKRKRD